MADAIPPVTTSNPWYTPPANAANVGKADKNMFMKLLVAQMRNQDPMAPSDGTQFLGELAQFEQLEQSTNTGEDIAAIRTRLDEMAGAQKS
jgi:flagellar basal-body rod modification protein FlgD